MKKHFVTSSFVLTEGGCRDPSKQLVRGGKDFERDKVCETPQFTNKMYICLDSRLGNDAH